MSQLCWGSVTPRGLGTNLVPDLPLGPSLLIFPLSTWESLLSWCVPPLLRWLSSGSWGGREVTAVT